MNNQQELRRALKSFYCARSLSRARVDFLLQAKNRMAQSARARLAIPLLQIAALTAAIVIFLLVADHEEYQRALERAVFAEVAMNHMKHPPLEIISPHYSEVQATLSRLDFSIMPANSPILETYRLMGARYCSIQGVPAAQLWVQDIRSGKESTLYAVKAVGKLQAVAPTVGSMDGMRVEVWRQDNVLFALAERIDLIEIRLIVPMVYGSSAIDFDVQSHQGYSLFGWNKSGFNYLILSGLSEAEMEMLEDLLRAQADSSGTLNDVGSNGISEYRLCVLIICRRAQKIGDGVA